MPLISKLIWPMETPKMAGPIRVARHSIVVQPGAAAASGERDRAAESPAQQPAQNTPGQASTGIEERRQPERNPMATD